MGNKTNPYLQVGAGDKKKTDVWKSEIYLWYNLLNYTD